MKVHVSYLFLEKKLLAFILSVIAATKKRLRFTLNLILSALLHWHVEDYFSIYTEDPKRSIMDMVYGLVFCCIVTWTRFIFQAQEVEFFPTCLTSSLHLDLLLDLKLKHSFCLQQKFPRCRPEPTWASNQHLPIRALQSIGS